MELRDVRAFVAVAEQQSFTRAAAVLHIAQPSLSQQIKKLEAELGVELFHRTKRSVRLTGAGELVLAEARSLLAQASITEEIARLGASGELGALAIGFIESASLAILPQLIRSFRSVHPKVSLHLRELSTTQQIAALKERTIDIGIVRGPLADDQIETKHLRREPLVVAIPSVNALAGEAAVPLRALRNEEFIAYMGPRAARLHAEIMELCGRGGFMPAVVQSAEEYHTICSLVAAGLGVSIVPSSVCAIAIDGVAYRKLVDPEVTLDYHAAWLRTSRVPALKRFVSMLSTAAALRDESAALAAGMIGSGAEDRRCAVPQL